MLKVIFIVVLIVIIFFAISYGVYSYDAQKRMKQRGKLECITIDSKTLAGEQVTNSIFEEYQITMVNIWGTYCPSCIKELSYLQEIYEEEKDKGIGLLGIVIDVKSEKINSKQLNKLNKIIEENKVGYPNVLTDATFRESISNKVFIVPTTVIVNQKGEVISEVVEEAYTKEQYKKMIFETMLSNPY